MNRKNILIVVLFILVIGLVIFNLIQSRVDMAIIDISDPITPQEEKTENNPDINKETEIINNNKNMEENNIVNFTSVIKDVVDDMPTDGLSYYIIEEDKTVLFGDGETAETWYGDHYPPLPIGTEIEIQAVKSEDWDYSVISNDEELAGKLYIVENFENYVVFSKDNGYPYISKEFVRYTPSNKDAGKGIQILNNNLKDNENLLDLEEYKIQIFGYLNENGKKHLWANYFCRNSSNDWREKQVMVLDGGNCYFNAKVNLDSGEVFDLQIHGDA